MRPLPPGTTFGIVSVDFHRAIPVSPNSNWSISGKSGTGHLSARHESLGHLAAARSATNPPKLDPTLPKEVESERGDVLRKQQFGQSLIGVAVLVGEKPVAEDCQSVRSIRR